MPDRISYSEQELQEWISLWLDGALEPEPFEELKSILRVSEKAREVFWSYATIQSRLMFDGRVMGELDAVLSAPRTTAVASEDRVGGLLGLLGATPQSSQHWAYAPLLAASIALMAGLSWTIFAWETGPAQAPGVASARGATAQRVARVSQVSEDCVWRFDRRGVAPPQSLDDSREVFQDSTLRVTRGSLMLSFDNGVEMNLIGPALIDVDTRMRTRLLSGRVRAKVAPGAEGFCVDVPQATVVDLGTEFGIEVDAEGRSDVVVFDGQVNVDVQAVDSKPAETRSLVMGEALRIDENRQASRLASIFSNRFDASPTNPQELGRQPLITVVEDNVDRIWNYYEIVHSGMREDAKALVAVSREHEWNGLTELGMPGYLLGGDYVRVFKEDQIVSDIEVRVTLASPAKLFILFDERVPVPSWLRSDFHLTGDRLGLDMGPWQGPTGDEYEYSVGPGKSIDRVVNIWESNRPMSGVVHLGATESLELGTLMYGIVAQPAEDDPRAATRL